MLTEIAGGGDHAPQMIGRLGAVDMEMTKEATIAKRKARGLITREKGKAGIIARHG